MIKSLVSILILLVSSFSLFANTNLELSSDKSTVKWEGKKVLGNHYGKINVKSGNIEFDGDKITGGMVVVDMNTLTVEDIEDEVMNSKLKGHLMSDDFFSIEKNGTSTFKLKSSKENKGKLDITGDLTIKGITKEVSFPAEFTHKEGYASIKGKLVVDRTKFDIKYGSGSFFDNLGDKTIDNDFTLDLDIKFMK